MNHVSVKGNLTRDPETKWLPSGMAITEFGVAVNERYTNKDGEKMEKVLFLNCKAWGKLGDEVICKFFSKGSPILVWGRLDVEEWEDRESLQKRSKTVIVVEGFDFCGEKRETERAPGSNEQRARPAQQTARPAPARTAAPVDKRQQDPPPEQEEDDPNSIPF